MAEHISGHAPAAIAKRMSSRGCTIITTLLKNLVDANLVRCSCRDLQDPSFFEEAERLWVWKFDGNNMYMDLGETVGAGWGVWKCEGRYVYTDIKEMVQAGLLLHVKRPYQEIIQPNSHSETPREKSTMWKGAVPKGRMRASERAGVEHTCEQIFQISRRYIYLLPYTLAYLSTRASRHYKRPFQGARAPLQHTADTTRAGKRDGRRPPDRQRGKAVFAV
eukprot:111793-Chlamydomonas_euryale.AAC.4